MATLTVRSPDDEVERRLRIRAAEHGCSAEAENRAILRAVLGGEDAQSATRLQAAARLAEFCRRTAARGSASAAVLLEELRGLRSAERGGCRSRTGIWRGPGPWRGAAAGAAF